MVAVKGKKTRIRLETWATSARGIELHIADTLRCLPLILQETHARSNPKLKVRNRSGNPAWKMVEHPLFTTPDTGWSSHANTPHNMPLEACIARKNIFAHRLSVRAACELPLKVIPGAEVVHALHQRKVPIKEIIVIRLCPPPIIKGAEWLDCLSHAVGGNVVCYSGRV